MEVVRVFNNELSSLYEVKPPISKAKMTQITKSAIKGIKFYKHIVQSVEKFIQKCRPEYKVPGLYVVDSIVRQSRHQFGADKDVFGPRFVKNITTTFQHLFKCAEDDRPKIIRVLNLWQKNNVFPIDVIQPLLDMGHPNTSNELNDEAQVPRHKTSDSSSWKGWPQGNDEPVPETQTYAEMSAKNLEKFTKAEMSNSVDDEVSRSSLFRNQSKVEKQPEETVKFNKKLLDFDYGDEEDEEEAKNDDSHLSNQPNALALSMAQNLLSNPELLRQLQQMQQTIQQNEALKSELGIQTQNAPKPEDSEANYSAHNSPQQPLLPSAPYQPVISHTLQLAQSESDKDDRVIPEPPLPPQDLDERSLASVMASHDRVLPPMPFTEASNMMSFQYDKSSIPFPPQQPPLPIMEPIPIDSTFPSVVPSEQHLLQNSQVDEDERVMYSMPGEPPLPPQDFDERTLMIPVEDRSGKDRSRSRSGSRNRARSGRHRSRSRSPRRKRSRSRSHSRKNRSRSRERERIREKERERERERERRRKGIPPIKKGCVSVCSTTLWLGHVPKSCSEVDISNTFGPYGTILSIDMIPPRGCAYVVMDRRQDGYRALQKLKNLKLQGSSIKMAWAPGKGVKGKEYKDYWEVDLGVSYVPYEKIPEDAEALDLLEEGGFIDEESLPEHLRALRKQPEEEKHSFTSNNKIVTETSVPFSEIQVPPNMVPPPIMPPASVSLPMVLPHLMQPQFGLPLPGLLPPQAMVMPVPMGIPPPNPMLMVQQQSQNMLASQPLPVVGGVPQMVPRTVPPVPSALQNLKNAAHPETTLGSPMIPATTVGDATPTDEDGTSVSSPAGVHMSTNSTVSTSTIPITSAHQGVSLTQFNPIMGLHTANRPMLSVPPPVSAACTPIPYPPPNVSFNFPPPGIRPPGPGHSVVAPNSQFQWMQKTSSSPFTDADSSQSANSTVSRPIAPPQPVMPMHMFGNRPPFHEPPSSMSVNQSAMKESHIMKNRDDRKSNDMENLGNRNVSPIHDKMLQEMVISTDDESSTDRDYPRNDMPVGPRFQGITEFPRGPMNMQRMRGPPGPIQGPRFPRGMHMGSPFPMRMGGPRGMPGPGMHPRMEMEFHPGPRGPRMPGGPMGPRRGDMHPPHDGRDWYPRDFDAPPFERERDRRYHEEWGREEWVTPEELEVDARRMSRDRDDGRREDRRDHWNRDGPSRPDISRTSKENDQKEPSGSNKSDSGKLKQKPVNKSRADDLMDDMLKLRFYQRDKAPNISLSNKKYSQIQNRNDLSKEKQGHNNNNNDNNNNNNKEENQDTSKPKGDNDTEIQSSNEKPNDKELVSETPPNSDQSSRREKDRESRKRSRWGRTLSEEREFQQQKRNEIEMKFQSYEQSHAAQQPAPSAVQNSCDEPKAELVETTEATNSEILTSEVTECDMLSTEEPSTIVTEPSTCNITETEVVENHVDCSSSTEVNNSNDLDVNVDPSCNVKCETNEAAENANENELPLVSAES